ncbi:Glucosaminyl phosphatidylinositol (GlcN-PI) nositol acylation protein [Hypocenomyce scalaris]|nr:Glucosaminyl phosphatidylinositol (GlcN-PI) nositol acylation protein [Hypocenomyce scalaris]
MAQSYKTLKEDFVSNLSGGQISEINYVTAVAPAAVLLWSALQSRQAFFVKYGPAAFATDFLLNVGAILLATTLYSSVPVLLNLLLLSPAFVIYLLPVTTPSQKKLSKPQQGNGVMAGSGMRDNLEPLPIRPFVTSYRGAMMVVTCIAILAVDFEVFPRRFAKVENWGTSLMDMGVGSFVFSAGVVAAKPILKDRMAGKTSTLPQRLLRSIRHSLPLLGLGLVRLYSVKGLDYAEHVTEYGVHWNFFFTLAFLPPFVALFQTFFALIPSYEILSLLLSSIYQSSLEFTRLKAYILTAPRTNLLSQNREGVFSFFGYLAIFLAGQGTGIYILPRGVGLSPNSANATEQRGRLLIRLMSSSFIWTLLLVLATSYKYGFGLQVSRRLANLPYVLWVSAFNCTQIAIFCVIETISFPGVHKAADKTLERRESMKATSRVLKAFNTNGLAIFLLANLLTGVVNLTIKTLSVGREVAMGVLVAYAGLLTGIAVTLDAWDISIKM